MSDSYHNIGPMSFLFPKLDGYHKDLNTVEDYTKYCHDWIDKNRKVMAKYRSEIVDIEKHLMRMEVGDERRIYKYVEMIRESQLSRVIALIEALNKTDHKQYIFNPARCLSWRQKREE